MFNDKKEIDGAVYMTPAQIQELLRSVLAESHRMNPIEQKKFDEEMQKESRRAKLMVSLGKAEEESQRRKRDNCSHKRWPMTAGRRAGEMCPKSEPGEWTTGGQAYQDGTAAIICTRCSTVKRFRPGPEYYNAIIQNGLLNEPFPPEEICLCGSCNEIKTKCKCAELVTEHQRAVAVA